MAAAAEGDGEKVLQAAAAEEEVELGVIDFQWCGLGLGAVDVAYCIGASADPSVFSDGNDSDSGSNVQTIVQGYLDDYHQSLLEAFLQHGVASDAATATTLLPREVFQTQFEWAWIDLVRVVIGDHWSTITKAILAEREGKMAFNAYNKSLPVAMALTELAHVYLQRREAEGGH